MKKLSRICVLALAFVMLSCTIALPSQAATGSASIGSPTSGVSCTVETSWTTAYAIPDTSSQVEHTQGTMTQLTLTHNFTGSDKSYKTFAKAIGSTYASLAVQAGAKAGVAETATHTAYAGSVTFTIFPYDSGGKYRIEMVFPRHTASITVTEYSPSSNESTYGYIAYMPRPDDAYLRLNRYAD